MNPFVGVTSGLIAAGLAAATTDDAEWADKTVYKGNIVEYIRTISSFASRYVYTYNLGTYSTVTDAEGLEEAETSQLGDYFGYVVLYILLVAETIMFLWTYIKRLFKLAFYTMIAPLIAFMYPIDKLGDGKAQAFNTWFKEYMFNVLIQPLHLLLYTVFIYAAMELVKESMIYAIGAYGYMIVAEKFFKKIFGFDKAPGGTPGMAGPAMSHALGHGLERLGGFGPKGPKSGGKGGDGKSGSGIKLKKSPLPNPEGSGIIPTSDGGTGPAPLSGGGGPRSGGPIGGTRPGGGTRTTTPTSRRSPAPGSLPRTARFIGNHAMNAGRAIKGAATYRGHQAIRKLTGNKAATLRELASRRGLAGLAGNAVKFGTKAAVKTAGGIVGAGLGAIGGFASGALATALTGEDQIGQAAAAGVIGGTNRGVQFGDWVNGFAGDSIEGGKDIIASTDSDYAANLQAERAMANHPEMTAHDMDVYAEAIKHGAKAEEIENNFEDFQDFSRTADSNDDDKMQDLAWKMHYMSYDTSTEKARQESIDTEAGKIMRDDDRRSVYEKTVTENDISNARAAIYDERNQAVINARREGASPDIITALESKRDNITDEEANYRATYEKVKAGAGNLIDKYN